MASNLKLAAARIHQIRRARSSRVKPFTRIVVTTPFDTNESADAFLSRLDFAIRGGVVRSVSYTVGGERRVQEFERHESVSDRRSLPCVAHGMGAPLELASYVGRIRFLDPNVAGKNESISLARMGFCDTWTSKRRFETLKLGERNLERLQRRARDRNGAQLLATGPSLTSIDLNEALRDDALRVVCNSIVSNPRFMKAIRPDVVAFSDPAFHFGDSAYSEAFRRDLASRLKENPQLMAIFPAEFSAPVASIIQRFSDQAIPVPMAWTWKSSTLWLRKAGEGLRTGNIMTSLMLPVAALGNGRIELFGFDGRAPEDEGFWKHNSKVQYDDLYQSVRDRHPAFFSDVDYVAYYKQHCARVAAALAELERSGRTILTRTPSHVPALKERVRAGFLA